MPKVFLGLDLVQLDWLRAPDDVWARESPTDPEALFLVLQPRSHAFAGVAAILVALTSLVTTNLGGFGLGVALGVLGGALGFAWEPGDQSDRVRSPRVPDDRRRGPGGQAPVEPPTQPIRSTGPDPTTRRTLHGRVPDR